MTAGFSSRHGQPLALPVLARAELAWSGTSAELTRLRPIVDATLRRVVGRNDPEYEDLLQSALEGVLGALHVRARGEDYPSRWVAAITRNIAIDRLRARSRERRVFARETDAEPEVAALSAFEPEHLTHVRQELGRLSAALGKLGRSHAAVIYLHAVLGYELSEIASVLGTSVSAAQSRLVRGRRALSRDMAARTPGRAAR